MWGPTRLCDECSGRIVEFNQIARTSDRLRPAGRISRQSVCAIVRHARPSVTPIAPEATAIPFRSLPACILGTRHERRWTPPQRYFRSMEANAPGRRLVVSRISDIMSHLAFSREMAKQSPEGPVLLKRNRLRMPFPTRVRADTMLHMHIRVDQPS